MTVWASDNYSRRRVLRFLVLGQETLFCNEGNQTPAGPETIALLIAGKGMMLVHAPTRGLIEEEDCLQRQVPERSHHYGLKRRRGYVCQIQRQGSI